MHVGPVESLESIFCIPHIGVLDDSNGRVVPVHIGVHDGVGAIAAKILEILYEVELGHLKEPDRLHAVEIKRENTDGHSKSASPGCARRGHDSRWGPYAKHRNSLNSCASAPPNGQDYVKEPRHALLGGG